MSGTALVLEMTMLLLELGTILALLDRRQRGV